MSDLSPSQFATPGNPADTLAEVSPNQSPSGAGGRSWTANTEGEAILGAETRIVADEAGQGPLVTTLATVGHPTSGTWKTGQSVVDSNGVTWNCTAGGTPGTWVQSALVPSNNLSDVASASAALGHLGGLSLAGGTMRGAIAGFEDEGGQLYNARAYGCACDGVLAQDGAVTADSTTFTSAALEPFAGPKTILVDGAGASGETLVTTITCTQAGTGTLAVAATTTVTGAEAVWGTDDSTAWADTLLPAWYAGHGGTVYLPGISIASQLVIPNDGTTTSGNQGCSYQPPLRLTGNGPWFNGEWSNVLQAHGSILVLYGADGPAKIDTRGSGLLTLDHITLLSMANDAVPIIQTTNTTLSAHHYALVGRKSLSGSSCLQDGFILGGQGRTAASASITENTASLTIGAADYPFSDSMVGWQIVVRGAAASGADLLTTIASVQSSTACTLTVNASTTVSGAVAAYFAIGMDANAPFQGYGTTIKGPGYFSNIRRPIVGGFYCNGVEVGGFTVSLTCGNTSGQGAVEFYGTGGSGADVGNVVHPITLEAVHYTYGVRFVYANQNIVLGVSVYDGTPQAVVRCEEGSVGNLVLVAYNPGGVPVISDANSSTANMALSGLNNGTTFPDVYFANNATFLPGAAVLFQDAGGSWKYQWYLSGETLYLRDLVNAVMILEASTASKILTVASYQLQTNGIIRTVNSQAADYTLGDTDDLVVMNGTSLTATLPNAGNVNPGRIYTIKNINSSTLTIATYSSQTIDGAAPGTLAQWGVLRVASNGSNGWYTI